MTNRVSFDVETHSYMVNGNIAKLSITELLAKHNLAPNYIGVDSEILEKSAERGRAIHKDLEQVAKNAQYVPQTTEGEELVKWLSNVRKNAQITAEKPMGMIWKNLVLGGTPDLIIQTNEKTIIIDHKTTSVIHKKAVAWQLSLLDYMAQSNIENYHRATEFYCYHKCKMVAIEKIPDAEIELLLDCEMNDELYTEPSLVVSDTQFAMQYEQAEQIFMQKKKELDELEKNIKEFRAKLQTLFEEQGIQSWTSPSGSIQISYVSGTTTDKVDDEKLKNLYPEIYKECTKKSTRKPYLKISMKKGETNDI